MATSHGLCVTSKAKHIYDVEHVIMISQFLNLSCYVKLNMLRSTIRLARHEHLRTNASKSLYTKPWQ